MDEAAAGLALARPDSDSLRLDDEAVRRAIAMVERMGVLEALDTWRNESPRHPGGRPPLFSHKALVVAMALAVRERQGLTLIRFCTVMFKFISPEMRAELGIPDPPEPGDCKGWQAAYKNVRYRFHTLIEPMDPSPYPKNRRLTPEDFEAAVKAMTPEDEAQRRKRLAWFCNRVLAVSLDTVPRHIWRKWQGSVGLDATPIPAFARAEAKKGRRGPVMTYSADPDAAWYVREEDHRDLDSLPDSAGPAIKQLRKLRWAYELTLAIAGPTTTSERHTFPYLVVGMAPLHKPGHGPGHNAMVALADMADRGLPAGLIGCDRAYTGQKPENFRLPALALGYDLVIDYKDDQLGIQGSAHGALLVDGTWYSPGIPDVLISATGDHRAGLISTELWQERLAKRKAYRLRPKSRRDAEGFTRYLCPAAGTAPTVSCAHKKATTSRYMLGKTPVFLTPELEQNPPLICRQQSVTIGPQGGDRFQQPLSHGTPEWHDTYSTLRNTIEGLNGIVKDGSYEALADATKRRVRGVAAQSVLVAFGLLAVNLRKIDKFLELAVVEPDGTLRRPTKRRRKARPVQDFAPATSSGDPPNTG